VAELRLGETQVVPLSLDHPLPLPPHFWDAEVVVYVDDSHFCWNERALSAGLGLGKTSLIVYATLLSMLHYICMLCNARAFAS
jgi:hypothetical protein